MGMKTIEAQYISPVDVGSIILTKAVTESITVTAGVLQGFMVKRWDENTQVILVLRDLGPVAVDGSESIEVY